MTDKTFRILTAMSKFGGGFTKALAECGFRADADNLRKLEDAFPEYWEEYERVADIEDRKKASSAV